jgi:nucleotide-binding universal stress UspA family protein
MKVLVATDGSRAGMAAIRFAAKLGGTRPVVLTVITIGLDGDAPYYPAPGSPTDKSNEQWRAARALGSAERELARLKVHGDVRPFSSLSADAIPEAIAREARRAKADLVVVGSEPREDLREWVLGGLALRLIYIVQRPVAVIRPPRRRRSHAPALGSGAALR